MSEDFTLEPDQLAAVDFILSGEDSLVCADVGTGKTIIALTAAHRALQDKRVTRWLVLAPLLVATDTWAQEPTFWPHLKGVNLKVAAGLDEDERIAVIESDADIVVLNYENMLWLMERYPRTRGVSSLPFDGLICDELDKLKAVSSERFKAFREQVKHFKMRVGLTGTLIPNDLTEAWGQAFIVDGGASFGRSFYKWRSQYFYPVDYKQYDWRPHIGTREHIINTLADISIRLKGKNLPQVIFTTPHMIELPKDIMALYRKLDRELFLKVQDKEGRERSVAAANSAVLQGKLQQICAGFSYVDRLKEAVWHTTERFEWYDKLYNDLGEQLLVFYQFKEELSMLRQMYPDIRYLSGVGGAEARESIRLWNAGKLTQLALHPASAGHGLNLQKSGAHHIAFLTLPWSGGMLKQVIGRLARRRQTAKQIFVHTALCEKTVDEQVFDTARSRLDTMGEFLDDLEAASARARH
jgi:SNF2 family DNA or RNA helicase